jgi:hypothetical protein
LAPGTALENGVAMELGRNKLFGRASEVLAHPEIRRLFPGL